MILLMMARFLIFFFCCFSHWRFWLRSIQQFTVDRLIYWQQWNCMRHWQVTSFLLLFVLLSFRQLADWHVRAKTKNLNREFNICFWLSSIADNSRSRKFMLWFLLLSSLYVMISIKMCNRDTLQLMRKKKKNASLFMFNVITWAENNKKLLATICSCV